MLFNSFEYIFIFLPFTFIVYFYLNNKKFIIASKVFLVLASLFFYSWWNIIYLPLLLGSLLFNYVLGLLLINKKKSKVLSQKQLLLIGIIFNLSLLGYFKYADFFIFNINFIFSANVELLHIALPLAISFFTFQQIAYIVDLYRGEIKDTNFLNYSIFVTFFPQLIAGPIVHHKEMMPQFANIKTKIINLKNISLGLFIFSIGLFKKVVIADTFAVWANYGFDQAVNLTFLDSLGSLLSFTFQLYFDFSGYTDMAIGAALLFNIKLPINFNSPYKSTSIIEAWERWHMTLSRFINKYVFKTIVKSFNRYSFYKGMIAVFLSMLISGLWHGASWMFVSFGAIHAIALVINYIWIKKIKIAIPDFVGWFLMFSTVNLSFIFFRSNSIDDVFKIFDGFTGNNGFALTESFTKLTQLTGMFPFIAIGFIIIFFFKNSNELLKIMESSKTNHIKFLLLSIVCFGLSLMVMSLEKGSEFLYFNF